ncbi:MAG: hypothetical protein H6658_19710 [Ardenticatenaceae bacterium]|nr:hypothetical protein [Ardenticatenaceae bacterium]
MKIGQSNDRQLEKQRGGWLLFLLLVLALGVWLGQAGLMGWLGAGWEDLARVVAGGDTAVLPTLVIDMPFDNYNTILQQRDEAQTQGVFIADEADFVAATMELAGAVVRVRMRLLPGTAVHLNDDDKWNFDIRTRDDALLLNMQRFQLRDPADNNWLNEWAFLENLRREGLLATRYQFVQVQFNGNDWGIYALQEGFGPELATTQARPDGVMVEFAAERLWQSVAYFEGDLAAAIADPVTNLTADAFPLFEVDTFRDAAIADDPVLAAQKDSAIALLRGLQAGELTAAQVFDVAQYGRFLALVDLWGATEAVSLVNVRYYYRAADGRLEPIGFNGNPLRGNGRLPLNATYNDPDLQAAYVRAAQEVSQPEYLAQLEADLAAEWESWATAVRPETPATPPWQTLAQRQALMRQSLAPRQPIFATLGSPALSHEGLVQIDVANVLNLPIEIVGFDIDGAAFLEPDPAWLISGEGYTLPAFDGQSLHFTRFHLPLTALQDPELTFQQEPTIYIATRLVGQETVTLTPARPGIAIQP